MTTLAVETTDEAQRPDGNLTRPHPANERVESTSGAEPIEHGPGPDPGTAHSTGRRGRQIDYL